MLVRAVSVLQASSFLTPGLRVRVLRLMGVRAGVGASVGSRCAISGGQLVMGEHTRIGAEAYLQTEGLIEICDHAQLGPRVTLLTASHEIGPDYRRAHWRRDIIPKRIGKGAWICANVTVVPGADIADGCVIGAGSVVTKSTEPNGLYLGVPARRVKELAA